MSIANRIAQAGKKAAGLALSEMLGLVPRIVGQSGPPATSEDRSQMGSGVTENGLFGPLGTAPVFSVKQIKTGRFKGGWLIGSSVLSADGSWYDTTDEFFANRKADSSIKEGDTVEDRSILDVLIDRTCHHCMALATAEGDEELQSVMAPMLADAGNGAEAARQDFAVMALELLLHECDQALTQANVPPFVRNMVEGGVGDPEHIKKNFKKKVALAFIKHRRGDGTDPLTTALMRKMLAEAWISSVVPIEARHIPAAREALRRVLLENSLDLNGGLEAITDGTMTEKLEQQIIEFIIDRWL